MAAPSSSGARDTRGVMMRVPCGCVSLAGLQERVTDVHLEPASEGSATERSRQVGVRSYDPDVVAVDAEERPVSLPCRQHPFKTDL